MAVLGWVRASSRWQDAQVTLSEADKDDKDKETRKSRRQKAIVRASVWATLTLPRNRDRGPALAPRIVMTAGLRIIPGQRHMIFDVGRIEALGAFETVDRLAEISFAIEDQAVRILRHRAHRAIFGCATR